MCTNSDSLRRRSHQVMTRQSESSSPNYASNKMPVATIYATEVSSSAGEDDGVAKPAGTGIFRSQTARMVLSVSAVALLLVSFMGMGSGGGAPTVKDLSDTVMDLTRQLQNNMGIEDASRPNGKSTEELQHELDEKTIELAWEKQHVEDAETTKEFMYNSMREQIVNDHDLLDKTVGKIKQFAGKNAEIERKLMDEETENSNLKTALAFALEELAKERAKLPPAPGAPKIKDQDLVNDQRRTQTLRNKKRGFQPGDNIEIIEYQEGGKVALRPGIVAEIHDDGTFDLVKLEQSIMIKGFKSGQFQTYLAYHEGMHALYEVQREVYVPIRIMQFFPGSAQPHFELHGAYQFTYDSSPDEIREGPAMRMHRYAGIGEIIGDDERNEVLNQAMGGEE